MDGSGWHQRQPGSDERANGLTWDPQGRLVICEGGARRMTRLESDGTITVVADNFEGTKF